MMISSYLYIVKVINFVNELEVNEKSFSLKDEVLKYFIRDTERGTDTKTASHEVEQVYVNYKLWDKNQSRERVRITEVLLVNKYRV